MLRLKSRNTLPKGGFQYTIPQIPSWECPQMLGFDATVDAIIVVHKANPRHNLPTDRATVGDLLDLFNAKRLESMPGCQHFLISEEGQPVPKFHARSQPPTPPKGGAVSAGIKGAMAGAKRLTVGIGAWFAWLGEGLPMVDQDVAEKRAAICADCPLNQPATGPMQWIYDKVKRPISELLQIKNDQRVETSLDSKLFCCQACDCPMVLKVHCLPEIILQRERPEHLAKLDPRCWILKEKEATNQ